MEWKRTNPKLIRVLKNGSWIDLKPVGNGYMYAEQILNGSTCKRQNFAQQKGTCLQYYLGFMIL